MRSRRPTRQGREARRSLGEWWEMGGSEKGREGREETWNGEKQAVVGRKGRMERKRECMKEEEIKKKNNNKKTKRGIRKMKLWLGREK